MCHLVYIPCKSYKVTTQLSGHCDMVFTSEVNIRQGSRLIVAVFRTKVFVRYYLHLCCLQNQNDEAPHRMTKSSSWFSSLTRRASRLSSLSSLQTPAQKRSLDMRSPSDKQLLPSSNRPRLNK